MVGRARREAVGRASEVSLLVEADARRQRRLRAEGRRNERRRERHRLHGGNAFSGGQQRLGDGVAELGRRTIEEGGGRNDLQDRLVGRSPAEEQRVLGLVLEELDGDLLQTGRLRQVEAPGDDRIVAAVQNVEHGRIVDREAEVVARLHLEGPVTGEGQVDETLPQNHHRGTEDACRHAAPGNRAVSQRRPRHLPRLHRMVQIALDALEGAVQVSGVDEALATQVLVGLVVGGDQSIRELRVRQNFDRRRHGSHGTGRRDHVRSVGNALCEFPPPCPPSARR